METLAPDLLLEPGCLLALDDRICIRDARARCPRPSLALSPDGRGLLVSGRFSVLQRFSVSPGEGRAFVEATRDSNPIHTEDTVISGAMTAARLLLLPEMMLPGSAVKAVRLKFRAFSRYDRPTVNRYLFRPEPGGFAVDVAVLQQGTLVAEGSIRAGLLPAPGAPRPGPGLPELAEAPSASAGVVSAWYRSLRVDPARAFRAMGLGYPRAFLASLPSGEMVRKGGAGGLLNVLDLEFPEAGIPALSPEPPPTVEVEQGRPRPSFRKVLARVASGMVTYCHGYATVLLGMISGERAGARA